MVYYNHKRKEKINKKDDIKMIAVLSYVDGFGNDTQVDAIYPTLEIAKQYYSENFHYQEFEFGKVTFDIYDAKEAYPKKKKRR